MESFVKILFDFDKLPSKLILIVLILSGIILFVPTEFLQKVKLSSFNESYGHWVGISFISSVSFLIVTLITTLQKRSKSRKSNKKIEADIRKNLNALDPTEQSILREFYLVGSTVNLPADNPQVVGLQDKHIIRLAQSNLGGSYFMTGFDMPFMLTGYAKEVIERDIKLIGLPNPIDNQITEEQRIQLTEGRPPWTRPRW